MDTSEQMAIETSSRVKRRKRSVEEKRRIVEETLEAHASVARVAIPVSFIEFPLYFIRGPIAPVEIDCAKSIGCCRGPISFGASIG